MRGKAVPEDLSFLQEMTQESYSATPKDNINGWVLKKSTPNTKFWVKGNQGIVGVRGTKSTEDVSAWPTVPLNTLNTTNVYKKNFQAVQEFKNENPGIILYGVGHSLGGAILDSLIRDKMIHEAVSYNPAIQYRDINGGLPNRRIYYGSDPLYKLMGWWDRKSEWRKPTASSWIDFLGNFSLPAAGISAIASHSLKKFAGGMRGGGEMTDEFFKEVEAVTKHIVNRTIEIKLVVGGDTSTTTEIYESGKVLDPINKLSSKNYLSYVLLPLVQNAIVELNTVKEKQSMFDTKSKNTKFRKEKAEIIAKHLQIIFEELYSWRENLWRGPRPATFPTFEELAGNGSLRGGGEATDFLISNIVGAIQHDFNRNIEIRPAGKDSFDFFEDGVPLDDDFTAILVPNFMALIQQLRRLKNSKSKYGPISDDDWISVKKQAIINGAYYIRQALLNSDLPGRPYGAQPAPAPAPGQFPPQGVEYNAERTIAALQAGLRPPPTANAFTPENIIGEGITPAHVILHFGLDIPTAKSAIKKFVMRNHPDKGGDEEVFKSVVNAINRAYGQPMFGSGSGKLRGGGEMTSEFLKDASKLVKEILNRNVTILAEKKSIREPDGTKRPVMYYAFLEDDEPITGALTLTFERAVMKIINELEGEKYNKPWFKIGTKAWRERKQAIIVNGLEQIRQVLVQNIARLRGGPASRKFPVPDIPGRSPAPPPTFSPPRPPADIPGRTPGYEPQQSRTGRRFPSSAPASPAPPAGLNPLRQKAQALRNELMALTDEQFKARMGQTHTAARKEFRKVLFIIPSEDWSKDLFQDVMNKYSEVYGRSAFGAGKPRKNGRKVVFT